MTYDKTKVLTAVTAEEAHVDLGEGGLTLILTDDIAEAHHFGQATYPLLHEYIALINKYASESEQLTIMED